MFYDRFLPYQGRKWLPNSGGASSNGSSNAAFKLPKSGGQLPPPPAPL